MDLEELRFSKNSADLSTEGGFQFEFYCDRCGDAWRSRFDTYELGVASQALDTASSLFGGLLGRAADVADRAQDAAWQKAHDLAFRRAAAEYQQRFHRCNRCAQHFCDRCWNPERQLCLECAPDVATEMAAAQQAATVAQVVDKVSERDYTANLDLSGEAVARCPKCEARLDVGAKFCAECGTRLGVAQFCSECGVQLKPGAKFCFGCGHPTGGE